MSERKRCFVAVRFSEEVARRLAGTGQDLKQALGGARIRWVEPGNIHLTLQFLGDVDTGLLPKLTGGLSGAFGDVQPFAVHLQGVGAFPSSHRPRVIWMGIQAGVDGLKTLAACVHRVTEPLGYPAEDRPFRAHVTLGRVKDARKSRGISEVLEGREETEAGRCQIDMVHLVASELKPSGPIYTTLDSFELGR